MPEYRCANVPGGTYFFTVNTYRRQTFLTDADVRTALRETIGTIRQTHPFGIDAWSSCPIIFMPFGQCRPLIIISPIAGASSSASSPKVAQRDSTERSGQRSVVDNATRARSGSIGFGNISFGTGDDFNRHVDYLHWNPVQHGYVRAMKDWPYSSYHRYVKRGLLPPDWGSALPLFDGDTFGE